MLALPSADGKSILTVTADPEEFFRTRDGRTGRVVDSLEFPSINVGAWRSDGRQILRTGVPPDQSALTPTLLEFPSGRVVAALPGHTAVVNAMAFSNDGMRVATADADGFVKVWEGG